MIERVTGLDFDAFKKAYLEQVNKLIPSGELVITDEELVKLYLSHAVVMQFQYQEMNKSYTLDKNKS